MFADFLVGVFLSFFAIYGLVQTILNVFSYIGEHKMFRDKTIYTVLTVKNEEERIEGLVNSLLLKVLKNDNGASNSKIAIVDLDSTDKTLEILEMIKRDKPQIDIYTKKSFIDEISR